MQPFWIPNLGYDILLPMAHKSWNQTDHFRSNRAVLQIHRESFLSGCVFQRKFCRSKSSRSTGHLAGESEITVRCAGTNRRAFSFSAQGSSRLVFSSGSMLIQSASLVWNSTILMLRNSNSNNSVIEWRSKKSTQQCSARNQRIRPLRHRSFCSLSKLLAPRVFLLGQKEAMGRWTYLFVSLTKTTPN